MGLLGKEVEENLTRLVTLLEWLKEFLQTHAVKISIERKEGKNV
jgi:hypothetical protein